MLFLVSNVLALFTFSFLLSLLYTPLSGEPIGRCCSTDSNYTSGSTFENNLKLLLPSLTSNSSKSGFYNDTSGDRDSAYGLLLCRGDVTPDQCRICASTVARDAVEACSGSVSVTVWEENCMLRYSDVMFFSMLNSTRSYQPNQQTISDPNEFNRVLMELLGNISSAAASRNSKSMFATGHRNFSSAQRVYGLAQCTRDLSKKNCSLCLEEAIGDIPRCCDGKRGASILGLSCNLRYEVYPFYRELGDAGAALRLPSPTPSAAPPASATTGGRKGRSSRTPATTFPLGIALVLILAIAFCFLRCRKTPVRAPTDGVDQGVEGSESVQFDLESVRAATDDFSEENKLGEGGFGAVYKGRLPDGQEIAVKRLSSYSGQGVAEFKSEVALIAKLQHRNLVRVLGFCVDGLEKLLIYEYVPNTSLDRFLFDPTKRESLDWDTRYGIIVGITRGLLYLHEDSQLRIFHRDLKASNVLLDAKMNPKISDFGLAKVVGEETHITVTRIAGTYGYMAPEYAAHGKFSAKSEVFSFGVLTLEIVTGRKNNTYYESDGAEYLLGDAWQRWKDGRFLELVDPTIRESCSRDEAMRCIHTGLLCVQEDPADRPTMSKVLLLLSGHSTSLPAPSKPAFSISSRMALDPTTEVSSRSGDESNQYSTSMGPR